MAKNYKSKETILVITLGFLLLFLIFRKDLFLYTAFSIGVVGVVSEYISTKIDFFWTGLSHVLGKISTFIILSAIFLIAVVPIGLVRQLMKKTILRIDDKKSYFIDRDHLYHKDDMKNPW